MDYIGRPGSDLFTDPGGYGGGGVPPDFMSAVIAALIAQGIDVTVMGPDQIQSLASALWANQRLQHEYGLLSGQTIAGQPVSISPQTLLKQIEKELFSPAESTTKAALDAGLKLLQQNNRKLSKDQADYLATGSPAGGSSGYLADLARQAGFPESEIETAVAVAMAESGGRADAKGDMDIGGSFGLWQIYTKAHPDLVQKYDLFDPLQNAKAAYEVWKNAGGSWAPWSAYKNGSYLQFLGQQGPFVKGGPTGTDLKSIYPEAASRFRAYYGRDPSNAELMGMAGMNTDQIDQYLRSQRSHVPGMNFGQLHDLGAVANKVAMEMLGHNLTDGQMLELHNLGYGSEKDIRAWLDEMGIEGKLDKPTYAAMVKLNSGYMGGISNQPRGVDPRYITDQYNRAKTAGITDRQIQAAAEALPEAIAHPKMLQPPSGHQLTTAEQAQLTAPRLPQPPAAQAVAHSRSEREER